MTSRFPTSSPGAESDDAPADVEALRGRRRVLLERLAAIRDDLGRGLDRDAGERSIELENAEVLDEIARVTEVELGEIEVRLSEARARAGS